MAEPASRSGDRLPSVFEAACELAPEARAGFLDRECAGDDPLRREVEDLLCANPAIGSPAGQQAGGIASWKMEPAR